MMKHQTIAVLMGGRSSEREVSLASGRNVADGLRAAGFSVVQIDIKPSGQWWSEEDGAAIVLEPGRPLEVAGRRIDAAFVALHGPFGEDGTIQGFLDTLGVPYTGSGVLASALAMNKVLTKRLLVEAGVPTAPFHAIEKPGWRACQQELAERILGDLDLPIVVKPSHEGSSMGISIVKKPGDLARAVDEALSFGQLAIAEKYVRGREIQCGVLGNDDPVALPLVEIITKNEFFDYEAKYDPTLADEIVPAPVDQEAADRVKELGIRSYRLFGCRGLARVDTFLTPSGDVLVSEINTIPGLTKESLFPKEAAAADIPFTELVTRIVELALETETSQGPVTVAAPGEG